MLLLLLLDTFVRPLKLHVVFSSFTRLNRSELYGIYEMAQKLNNSHVTFQGLENHVC